MAKTKAPKLIHSRTPLYHDENHKFYWNHCWYCGIEIYHAKTKQEICHKHNHFTRDHIIPESQGGGRGANTVPSCFACNKRKKDHSLEQFRVITFGKKGGLFYGEKREAELRELHKRGKLSLSMAVQIAMIRPAKPVFKPRAPRCLVRREMIYHTFMTRLLRKILG